MKLTVDYRKVVEIPLGQTEAVKSHRITIRTQDGRVYMSSAYNFQEAMAGAVGLIQTEFVDPANAES